MSSDSRRDALQRYSMVVTEGFGKHLVQYATDPNGEWVRYADVAALRATPPTNNADALSAAIERERLANMRADQAEEALAAVQQVQSIELERLREFQAKVEEAEARCCPEDVGFEEWIGELERRLGGTNAMASQAIGLLRQAYGHVALTAKLGSPHATTLAAELDAFLDTLPQPTNKELE